MKQFDYLIIGNSAGSVGCIEALRDIDHEGTIAVVSEEAYHVYSRALIPYYLSGKIGKEKLYYRPLNFYEEMKVNPILGKKATKVDFSKKEVELEDSSRVSYKKLLLATGGRSFVPEIKGINKKSIFSFVSMDDALEIEKVIDKVKHVVVLGGGVIGLMAAEVFKKRGKEVYVLELAGRVLAPVVDQTVSRMVEDLFRENGIGIYTKSTIEEITGEDYVKNVILTGGSSLSCDMLIVAVGVVPRLELVRNTGIKVNKGIVVNKRMETSVKDVYACGDCAEAYDFILGDRRLLPLWPNAYVGGRVAAFNMAGIKREYEWATAMNSMHFFDFYIISAGLTNVGQQDNLEIISRLDREKRIYTRFVLEDGEIKGMILAGKIDRAGIFLNLIRKKVDVSGFKQELFHKDFGYGCLPDGLRWELLKSDVILGVVGMV